MTGHEQRLGYPGREDTDLDLASRARAWLAYVLLAATGEVRGTHDRRQCEAVAAAFEAEIERRRREARQR